MKKILFLLPSFMFLFCILSCKEDKGRLIGVGDEPIEFTSDSYSMSATGGEFVTSVASVPFRISGLNSHSMDHMKDIYYPANEEGTLVETDCFTLERTVDNRLKFMVQPNKTGLERVYTITLVAGNRSDFLEFTQTAN